MTIQAMFTIPMVVQRAGLTADRYGNAGIDWAHPVSTNILGWLDTNQRKMGEDDKNRSGADSDGNAFLPPETDIRSSDRLIINGQTYEVFGIPAPVSRPGWGLHHIECRIKRFEG